ncbi:hypothetical protein [Candidatus Enterococcus ferrettii]|uniref:DUF2262 domain-containing protein n=1 Tax=Candidatus Enterococcus ferrettii TaxID=2815324 RepID=A0ABV0EPK3_9ENTE|nr:hypothetical protein [Enterococcus sp. 665A]MBO1338878.1 hypothetical protein [Enterococcus sp. 665A]
MLEKDFIYNSKEKEYCIEQKGVEISIDESLMDHEIAAYAVEVLNAYFNQLGLICDVLLEDEGFTIFFGDVSKNSMPKKLHEPSIRILSKNEGIISYCNHEYDDTHIIDIEFSGVLEDFSNVGIDG